MQENLRISLFALEIDPHLNRGIRRVNQPGVANATRIADSSSTNAVSSFIRVHPLCGHCGYSLPELRQLALNEIAVQLVAWLGDPDYTESRRTASSFSGVRNVLRYFQRCAGINVAVSNKKNGARNRAPFSLLASSDISSVSCGPEQLASDATSVLSC
jgi:hypothetical protein